MTDRPDRPDRPAEEPLAPAEARAREAVRTLPAVPAEPAFRVRLRERFVHGGLEESGARSDAIPIAARRPGFDRMRPALAWAAFAAVLVAAVVVVGVLNPGERWRVAHTQEATGNVLVDGDAVPATDFESLGEALIPGATIEWRGQGDLALVSPGQVAIVVMPGTILTLPEAPRRLFARTTRGEVTEGEIRLTTGASMRGARLVFATPEAEVTIRGTTLAVIREPMGTCVCVYEGSVQVRAGARDMGEVPAGHRQVVFHDGREPERAEIRPVENVELARMKESMGPMLDRKSNR